MIGCLVTALVTGLIPGLIPGLILAATPAANAAPAPAPAPAVAAPASDLFDKGRTAFGRGEYLRAIEILRPLLYPETRLETEGEVVQAHRMLGVSHLFANQPDDARREFRKLLELRPEYRFDPLLDPPRVVDFFNAIVKDEEQELFAIEAKRKKRAADLAARREREAERQRAREVVTVRSERHSYAVNFIPFGAGQFQNGERRRGWMFLSVEAGLAATSVGAFVTNFALFGIAPRRRCLVTPPLGADGLPEPCPAASIDRSDETLSTNLTRVQVASGALFFAVTLWGVIDAVRNFKSEVPLAGSGATPSPSAAARPPRTSFHLIPMMSPSGSPSGFGAAWRF